jgi:hypothetical protein
MTPGLTAFNANVRATMEAAYGRLTWEDIAAIVAAHPRIGERSDTSEQAGVTDDTRPELAAANRLRVAVLTYLPDVRRWPKRGGHARRTSRPPDK